MIISAPFLVNLFKPVVINLGHNLYTIREARLKTLVDTYSLRSKYIDLTAPNCRYSWHRDSTFIDDCIGSLTEVAKYYNEYVKSIGGHIWMSSLKSPRLEKIVVAQLDPIDPAIGQLWVNVNDNKLRTWAGSMWVDVTAQSGTTSSDPVHNANNIPDSTQPTQD